ncbi:MAG: TetR/AcrR family transcriptional regulator [Proteobacteria bacterium]|nr:TetR/AcrR family transcriptional regulator [Pseudomonadota bacterium]
MASIPELEAIRRSQILDAAINTMAKNGSANVTMADIAEAAGLSKGGLAHYFKSKDELFKEAFKYYYSAIFQFFKQAMDACDGPIEKILGFGLPLFNREIAQVNAAYKILYDLISLSAHNEEYRALFCEWIDEWLTLKKAAIDEGIKNGIFREHDSLSLAMSISSIFQGITTRWYFNPELHTKEWAEKAFEEAIRSLLKPYLI